MVPSTRIRAFAVVSVAATAFGALPAVAAPSQPGLVALASAIPAWAHQAAAAVVSGSSRIDVAMVLRPRHQAAQNRLESALNDPTSPSYRHYLTHQQYVARFAPTAAAASATTSWLRSAGLTVDRTTPSRTMVAAHGTANVVARAFHTSFGLFRVAGHLLRAPLSEPLIPSSLGSSVTAVTGLAQQRYVPNAPPAAAYVNARPCSRYYGEKRAMSAPRYAGAHQPYTVCGYTPQQLRSAYGVDAVHQSGRGATVGIVDAFASPSIEADANRWSRLHHLPTFRPGQFSQQLYPGATSLPEANIGGLIDFDPQGWQGEESLDVEAVHAMAPAANIIYYAATNIAAADPGLYLAEAQAIESGKVDIVSNSWSLPDDAPLITDQILFDILSGEAATTGVTLDYSTGDDGDEIANIGVRSVNFPSDSPQVTAVGGTTLRVGRGGRWLGENYWGDTKVPMLHGHWAWNKATASGGGGGGNSVLYDEPAWQQGVVPRSLATHGGVAPGRVVPDVSMDADSATGMLIGETMTFAGGKVHYGQFRVGGTSLSVPLFSGLLALAVQRNHGKRLGMIAPTLYHQARTAKGRLAVFRDPSSVKQRSGRTRLANVRVDFLDPANVGSPKVVTLRTLGNLGTLHQRRGFDDSTGLGSPKAPALVRALG
jgi:subtilase family serine protease